MRVTFKLKLILLTGCAALTIALMIAFSSWRDIEHRRTIADLESRLVPRVALALKLKSEFVELSRAFQDAAAAQDMDGLDEAEQRRTRIFDLISEGGSAIDPSAAAALRWRVQDYFETGVQVTTLLISGIAGEESVRMIATMHAQKLAAEKAVQAATVVDQAELAAAFESVRTSSLNSTRLRLATAMVGLTILVLLWLWANTQMLRGLSSLSAGLTRFATGDFEHAISLSSDDELSDVARDANSMAASLSELASHRNRADWLKSGQVELSVALRGNLTPEQVAALAAKCLVEHIGALAAAVYLAAEGGTLCLRGHYAHASDAESELPSASVPEGVGLLGEAFVGKQLKVISDLPPNYFRIFSGLGSGYATHLALFPLSMDERTIGVIEIALTRPLTELEREFLTSVESTLFVAFRSAEARARLDSLFTETRRQADRLAAQEEELRLSNQELSAQQEELRQTNQVLEQQQFALSQRNNELDQAQKRVLDKAEELGRVSAYKSQFLANMSHELRTPLNSMLLLSHLLAENEGKNLTDKQVEYCNTIHSAGDDLLALINQILDLSKIESGKEDVQIEEVILSQIASSVRKIFEPLAKEKRVGFSVTLDPSLPRCFLSDRLRIERILTNLLGNAIKFTEQGQVELQIALEKSAEADDDPKLTFVVRDTGIGIAPEEQERAFRPFEQIEATSARRFQGTGLGLAIVRESVRLLGGEISLFSELGKGSTFVCRFPLKAPQTRAENATSADLSPPSRSTSDSTSDVDLHVLVIEDDAILAEQLLSIIEERGLSGMIAATGELGLALAKSKHPAGIILDVKLPDVDGWTVMERLQSDPDTNHIPVHFLSALDAPETGLIRGAVGYMTKPATREELGEVVRGLVPDSRGSQEILVVEDSTSEENSVIALLRADGLSPEHVTNAQEALARLESERFGCIILDLGSKASDGLAFLETLRNRPGFEDVRIIVHTGRSLTRKESNQLQAYAQAIVLKDGRSSARLLEEVRLFVHHVRDQVPALDTTSVLPPADAEPSLRGSKVLLVEDDMRTVYSLSALLHSRGCHVVLAENGREALALLDEEKDVHCVLTDIMMPELDGYEMIQLLRADPRFQGLPIIALTAKAMSGERERCLAAGANAYLSKPVDSDKLLRTLYTWTREATRERREG